MLRKVDREMDDKVKQKDKKTEIEKQRKQLASLLVDIFGRGCCSACLVVKKLCKLKLHLRDFSNTNKLSLLKIEELVRLLFSEYFSVCACVCEREREGNRK